jgi:hypothetical protein
MWYLELRNIYLSRDIKSVSELYGQRMYVERFEDFFCMEGSEVHHFGESFLLLQQREIVQCFPEIYSDSIIRK